LTTIIVLFPVALMPGMGGFLFRPLWFALMFAMLSSFVLSRTLVPTMCAKFLTAHQHGGEEYRRSNWAQRFFERFESLLHRVTRGYSRLLEWALVHRPLVLAAAALLFLGSLSLVWGIGREFFPQVDAGQLTLYVRAPSGTGLEETERRVAQVEKFLRQHIPAAERRMIVSEVGLVPDFSAAYTANSGTQDSVIKVQLTEERSLSAQEYGVKLRRLVNQDPGFADLRVSF